MKIYAGGPGQPVLVYVDAEPARVLDSEHELGWGDGLPGSSRLALALLKDAMEDDVQASKYHQRFKHRAVALWPKDQAWSTTDKEILEVVADIKKVELETQQTRRIVMQEAPPVVAEGGGGVKWTKTDMPQPNKVVHD